MFERLRGLFGAETDQADTSAAGGQRDGWQFERADEEPYEHPTEAVDDIKALKRSGRHEEAEDLLDWCLDYTEAESRHKEGFAPAPAYYRHLAVIYRKDDRHQDEVAVLERYVDACEAVGVEPGDELVERLDRARELAAG